MRDMPKLHVEIELDAADDRRLLRGALLAARGSELSEMQRRGLRLSAGYGTESAREGMTAEVAQARRRLELLDRLIAALHAEAAGPHGVPSSPMEQRISLITLGVRDVGRARRFYEALGWRSAAAADDDVAFFQAGGSVLALWGRDELAKDSGVEDPGGWGGVTLAYNVRSPAEVDAVLAAAEQSGARLARPGAATFWGGYSGVFVDPDGHPWEVAHNPFWSIAEDGSVRLPDAPTT